MENALSISSVRSLDPAETAEKWHGRVEDPPEVEDPDDPDYMDDGQKAAAFQIPDKAEYHNTAVGPATYPDKAEYHNTAVGPATHLDPGPSTSSGPKVNVWNPLGQPSGPSANWRPPPDSFASSHLSPSTYAPNGVWTYQGDNNWLRKEGAHFTAIKGPPPGFSQGWPGPRPPAPLPGPPRLVMGPRMPGMAAGPIRTEGCPRPPRRPERDKLLRQQLNAGPPEDLDRGVREHLDDVQDPLMTMRGAVRNLTRKEELEPPPPGEPGSTPPPQKGGVLFYTLRKIVGVPAISPPHPDAPIPKISANELQAWTPVDQWNCVAFLYYRHASLTMEVTPAGAKEKHSGLFTPTVGDGTIGYWVPYQSAIGARLAAMVNALTARSVAKERSMMRAFGLGLKEPGSAEYNQKTVYAEPPDLTQMGRWVGNAPGSPPGYYRPGLPPNVAELARLVEGERDKTIHRVAHLVQALEKCPRFEPHLSLRDQWLPRSTREQVKLWTEATPILSAVRFAPAKKTPSHPEPVTGYRLKALWYATDQEIGIIQKKVGIFAEDSKRNYFFEGHPLSMSWMYG